MKVRSDIVKVYKDVHIWAGILSGLMLFVAFYAGALTMFAQPLERWAAPPSALAAPPPLQRAPELVAATLAAHPEAAAGYTIRIAPPPESPARMTWRVTGKNRRDFTEYGASFAADGSLQVARIERSPVAALIDTLHQKVGLPFPHAVAEPLMGAVALLYALALVSGVIVLLPTLAKDFFALRIGRNIKRMWLDVHNALGIVSLPFHLVMALTSVVFAFHDQFYDAQQVVVHPQAIRWSEPAPPDPPGARALAPAQLLERVRTQLPASFEVQGLTFAHKGGHTRAQVEGVDARHGSRAPSYVRAGVDPFTGQVALDDLPGRQDGWNTAVTTFFMLHFGSFGGTPVRWAYFLLGLAGALLFYTGNLLWLESRRRKQRGAEPVAQKRSARVLGGLTVGVSLGCVAGVSATLAAAKWLPGRVHDPESWHYGIYYAVFAAAVAWALRRGAARAACELLVLCALATLAIPLGSLAGAAGLGGVWNHAGASVAVDLTALAAVPLLLLAAQRTRRRVHQGHPDSVWHAGAAGGCDVQSP